MVDKIEIVVTEVTDIEARVYARYLGDPAGVVITGTIRGPYCETARTLPAEYLFRTVDSSSRGTAEAVVPDPCKWTPEVPHVYEVNVVARRGDEVVAEYRGAVGLRRLNERTFD
jgi:beta-galactosidase/beta-glucuronidase